MVHRPADSRLLSNLLQQEKEYSKQLSQLLESSNASLASFTAYAAASPPPGSHVIMSVAGSLAGIDEALKRYAQGVDEWRETMRSLKDAEEEVGNIMRDREILVTRLIKASNSKKSGAGNIRESLLLNHQRFPSSSSLSLSIGGESPSPSPSRPLSASFSSSTKLAAAQSELQACETHLAAKERELAIKRCTAIRDGLGARIRALMECGWVWSEVGKDVLRVLEELEPEPEQRHSIIRQSPSNNPRECNRPSSDFSSIGPSQSASQVTLNHGHEEHPPSEPATIHSVMDAPAFGEPISPSVATTTAVAAPTPPPAESNTNRPRPPSGTSTTTAGSSIRYSLATPATYTLETVTYAQAIPLHVGGSGAVIATETERSTDKGKAKENTTNSSSVARSASPYAPISYATFKDEDLHTTMRIPAPHAIEGYAPGIPTAGPSSGFNQYGGYSTPRSRPSSGVGIPVPQPQPQLQLQPSINLDHGKRHKLDRKITEEELRRRSSEAEDEVSSLEEIMVQKKWVKEGKIEVVENPRFMTEARRKELERRRKEESTPVVKEEKKKFSLFSHHHHRSEPHSAAAIQQPAVEHEQEAGGASALPPPSEGSPSTATGSPSKATDSPPKSSNSPSKGWFIGGLKGFFGPRQSTPQSSPTRQRSTKSTKTTASITAVVHSRSRTLPSDDSDVEEDSSPSKPKGFHALFGKSPAKQKSKWETRTDNNIREITSQRRGNSFDGVSPRRGAVKEVVGPPAAAATTVDLGAGLGSGQKSMRERTVSDVGTSSRVAAVPGGRKLKKTRAGGGPPLSASAAAAAAGENWSTISVASSSNIGPTTPVAPLPVAAPPAPVTAPPAPVAAAVAPVPAPAATTQPQPRTLSTSAVMGGTGKNGTRRSASVDVNRRGRDEPEEKEGEMIVDLGRRRATSDVGGVKEKEKAPPMPTDSPTIKTAASKGYSSDTAMVRNDSTKKQVPAPVVQHAYISSTSTSTPSRRASIKSSTSTPSKSPGISSTSGIPATVLQAGGENPSGTLVPYPGWDAQAQPSLGGSLSRNTSFGSAASAPAAGGGGRGKPTVLGQGASRAGRKPSVRSSAAPVSVPGQGTSTSTAAAVKRDVPADAVAVAPRPAASSLMSIVENVSRSNRGWSEELKMRKSVGGSRTAKANLLDGMVVRAPPPVPRGALESLNVAEMFGSGGSTVGSATKPPPPPKATGLFEVKAPGSVFDRRHELIASMAAPSSKETPAASSTSQKQTPANVERRSSVKKAEATSTPSSASASAAKGKSPLRSAMRSASRSPSPRMTAVAGPSNVQHREGRAPLSNGSSHGAQQQQRMSKHERKGNAASTRREDSKGSGGDGDGDGDSVSTVFYSDQGESGAAASASEGEGEAKTKAGVMNGSAVPTRVNGHGHGHEKRKSGSEISHSTVSTVVGGSSGQQQRTQEQQQSQAESSQTPPRRRKSVRVSLKPTFSPSPPAIEYDYEEEHQRYAAWERKDERSEKDHSPSRLHPPPPPHAAVVAPKPVHAAPAQHRLVVDRDVGDMWEDSGEDEDEQYATAKSLLTRAAKKDKDLMLKIARGRA